MDKNIYGMRLEGANFIRWQSTSCRDRRSLTSQEGSAFFDLPEQRKITLTNYVRVIR